MDSDFAIHITWTSYGTRLPGDERGYVSNTLQPSGKYAPKRNQIGTPYTRNDHVTQDRAAALQKHATAWLTADLALVVAQALVDCAQKRSWRILEAAVMASHMHVLVMNCPADGPAVRRVLKGNAQAWLSKAYGSPRKWFTTGGSDRFKNDPPAIEECVGYIHDQEGKLAGITNMRAFRV